MSTLNLSHFSKQNQFDSVGDRQREPSDREIDSLIGKYLRVHKAVQESSGPHVIADCVCPGCPNPTQHLYVNTISGLWNCVRCDESGNLFQLATVLGVRVREPNIVRVGSVAVKFNAQMESDRGGRQMPLSRQNLRNAPGLDLAKVISASERLFDPKDEAGVKVREYLYGRGLDDPTIRRFRLGVSWLTGEGASEVAVGIPYIEDELVPLMKMRNLESDKDRRKFRRTKGGYSGLFNGDSVKGLSRVVLVEGELDAISLWQLGVTNVASTSLGAKKEIPQEWVESLGAAEDIVLWYDEDEKGQESAEALITQLGAHRTRLARMPDGVNVKDANDLLRTRPLEEARTIARRAIDGAVGVENKTIQQPSHWMDALRASVFDAPKESTSTGWPTMDAMLSGVRTSELTVVTGHTNHGKTTWALNLARNLASAGHPVLVTAFENGPLPLVKKMFQMFAGRPLATLNGDPARFEYYADRLCEYPIHVVDAYGRPSLAQIVEWCTWAKFRLGVRHVFLDHLHFIAKSDGRVDDRDHLNDVLQTLVELSRHLDIAVFLIAHPRGLDADTLPNGHTVKGTSSAQQLADNGITVFRQVDPTGQTSSSILGKKAPKVRDSTGRKIDIELGPKDVLVSIWKARADEAREGYGVFTWQPSSLGYTDQTKQQQQQHTTPTAIGPTVGQTAHGTHDKDLPKTPQGEAAFDDSDFDDPTGDLFG